MKTHPLFVPLAAVVLSFPAPAFAVDPIIYFNDTPTNLIGMASRPGAPGVLEIEAADDFVLNTTKQITSGTFTGLIPAGSNISSVGFEIYRVFPLDSVNPPSGNVPTRVNSPSDTAFDSRGPATLSFTATLLQPNFTALNSVLNGISTNFGGEGAIRGNEVQVNFSLTTPLNLPADHYFFVPQVQLNTGTFYWLSASRPISGGGTTPFAPDLQTWIRNGNLDPDWLRVGTDIVGGTPAPTFNAAFSLSGTTVPDAAATLLLLLSGLASLIGFRHVAFRRTITPPA